MIWIPRAGSLMLCAPLASCCRLGCDRQLGLDDEAAAARGADAQLTADGGGALAHAEQAVTAGRRSGGGRGGGGGGPPLVTGAPQQRPPGGGALHGAGGR